MVTSIKRFGGAVNSSIFILLAAISLTGCPGGGGGATANNNTGATPDTGGGSGDTGGGGGTTGDTSGSSNTGGCTTNVAAGAPLFFIAGAKMLDGMDYHFLSQRFPTASNTGGSGQTTTYPPTDEQGSVDASYALTWTLSPALPDGFSFDTKTGRVEGTLQASISEMQTTTHTIRATNATGYSECTFNLVIYPLKADKMDVVGPPSSDAADDFIQFTLSPTAGTITTSDGPTYTVVNSREPTVELVVGDNGDGTVNKAVLTIDSNVYAARAPMGDTTCASCDRVAVITSSKLVGFDGQLLQRESGTGPNYVVLNGTFHYP